MPNSGTVLGTVAEIWRFPVKSFAGERITEAALDATGIPGDRRLALRDLESGKILSAKAPGVGTALLECAAALEAGGVVATIAGQSIPVADVDAFAAAAAAHLGRPVGLEHTVTETDTYDSYWPEIDDVLLSDVNVELPIAMSTAKTSFVDLAALQMVSTTSLAYLQRLLPDSDVRVERFRPSLVIDTSASSGAADEFVENRWTGRSARLGDAVISLTDASPRCVMTTLAQRDLPRDRAILQTLARHNRVETEGLGAFACLGIYAEIVEPGRVGEGDALTLLD
jgi:uncharacterized protein YcbX